MCQLQCFLPTWLLVPKSEKLETVCFQYLIVTVIECKCMEWRNTFWSRHSFCRMLYASLKSIWNYKKVSTWIVCSCFKAYVKDYTVLRMQGKNYTIFLAFIIGSGSVTEFYNFLDVCVTSMDNTGKIYS